MSQLADDSDRSSMRLHDRLGDRQAHAGSLHAIALIRSAVKFIENETEFRFPDTRSLIGNAKGYKLVFLVRADSDGVLRSRIQIRILNEMNENFLCTCRVCSNLQVRILHFNPD